MKTLLALLVLSSSALGQQAGYPPWPGYPNAEFAPVFDAQDFKLDSNAMGRSLAPLAFQPMSFAQLAEANKPRLMVPPVTAKPIRITNSRGQIQGTIQTRANGVTTVRDSRGRVTHTATVRAGTVVVKDAKSGKKK